MLAVALFIFIAGLIIGIGAVSVIETLGFLGRHSSYWTETTIRTHKVTKPLIWLGTILAILGGVLTYRELGFDWHAKYHLVAATLLVLNGSFLSFWLSPRLLKREAHGQAGELLPANWQFAITLSFFVSIFFWWSSVAVLVDLLVANLPR